MLIGGLGVGYSLAEAVQNTRTIQVTVIEIEQKIIEWNKLHFMNFCGNAMESTKTKIVCADLIHWISQAHESFDVICLDIDNGPDWTVFQNNDCLYDDKGLTTLSRLLKPDGVVSFWSASSSPTFMDRLKRHFSKVKEVAIERERSGEPDYVYIAG